MQLAKNTMWETPQDKWLVSPRTNSHKKGEGGPLCCKIRDNQP